MLEPVSLPTAALFNILSAELGGLPADAAKVSRMAQLNRWEKVGVGDVVLAVGGPPAVVGKIGMLAMVADEVAVCHLHLFTFVEMAGPRAAKYRPSGTYCIVALDDIICALVHADSGLITVLSPVHLDAPPFS